MMRSVSLARYAVALLVVLCGCAGGAPHGQPRAEPAALPDVRELAPADPATGVLSPGARTLLDAHNAYPERGRWGDRIDRALATGLPLAIEQDLHWSVQDGTGASLVAHDDDALRGAPTLDAYFFARIRPLMERALAENKRETWPVLVLNLDFKDNTPAHLDHVWTLLGRYEAWLTTSRRTANPARVEPFTPGPLLVLTGADTAQRRRFHDDVPVGASLRAFGAMRPAPVAGVTRGARMRRAIRMSPAQHIPSRADNYARWVNFPWNVVEQGGPPDAGAWDARDSVRLTALVRRAHERGFFIRFYTLDGFASGDDRGFSAGYNFGSQGAAAPRWLAAMQSRVDFIATDQYEDFAELRRTEARRVSPASSRD